MEIPGVPEVLLRALVAAAQSERLALVGGAVRDLLLHRVHKQQWNGLPDIDLVYEGSAVDLVQRLVMNLPAGTFCHIREHGAYGTVELKLIFGDAGVWFLDVATARSESYPLAAGNPLVGAGCIEDDLCRRDFTINAIAMLLSPGVSGGELLDPHHGQDDLAHRCLRFLHSASLIDDPTRLLRAARYAARLSMELEPTSLAQARAVISRWPWLWRHGDPAQQAPPGLATRLRMELVLLLEREPWFQALEHLQSWGGLSLLDPGLQNTQRWRMALLRAHRYSLDKLPVLLACGDDPITTAERLQLPHRQQRMLKAFVQLRSSFAELPSALLDIWQASEWTDWLESQPCPEQAVHLALLCADVPRRPLLMWLFYWRHVNAGVSATDLIDSGVPVGPSIGQRLRELRANRLKQYEETP